MSLVAVLDLGSLPTSHRKVDLLLACGTSTIVRLSVDPIPLPQGTIRRSVQVSWLSRPADTTPKELTFEIAWADVPQILRDACSKWSNTKNAHDITEEAAIGVMALLIHELEGAEIQSVLQIGSGGDYLIRVTGQPPMQIESSGIHNDPNGYFTTARLKEKSKQVLSKCPTGFASVVSFCHTASREVKCYLHCVSRPANTVDIRDSTEKPRTSKK